MKDNEYANTPIARFMDLDPAERWVKVRVEATRLGFRHAVAPDLLLQGQIDVEKTAAYVMLNFMTDVVSRRLRQGEVTKNKEVKFAIPASPWHFFRWRHRTSWWNRLLTHWGRQIQQQTLRTSVFLTARASEIGFFPHAEVPPHLPGLGMEYNGVVFDGYQQIVEDRQSRREIT